MNIFFPYFRVINKKTTSKGFFMVELMMVVSVAVIISTIVLSNYGRFNNKIILDSLAYKMALVIRNAQSYSLFVKGGGAGGFNRGYGVHFDKNISNSFVLFDDINKDNRYQSNELLQTFILQKGITIRTFCGVISGGSEECSPSVEYLDISFFRPDPDAIIKSNINTYQTAKVYITSPSGSEKIVFTEITGQIYIQ